MAIVRNELFDLEKTINSGQCFRSDCSEVVQDDKVVNLYRIKAFINGEDRSLFIVEDKEKPFEYEFACSDEEFPMWEKYFDITPEADNEYKYFEELMKTYESYESADLYLKDTKFLTRCFNFSKGIRILKQDPWEVLVSFIISQNNNIPKIKNSIRMICELNGGKFPNQRELFELDLSQCKLGYRQKYLEDLANCNLENRLYFLRYYKSNELKLLIDDLKKFKGVGDKVANCIALFGFHFLNAFPVDTWINKVGTKEFKYYRNGSFSLTNDCRINYTSLYRTRKGLTQQYMYYYALNHKEEYLNKEE